MPVRKFRSIEEMRPPWRERGSPQLDRALRRVLELGSTMARLSFRPGVRSYRTIEEAERDRCGAGRRSAPSEFPSKSADDLTSDTTPTARGSRTR